MKSCHAGLVDHAVAHHADACGSGSLYLNFNFAFVQLAIAQLLSEAIAGTLVELCIRAGYHVAGWRSGLGKSGAFYRRNQDIQNHLFHGFDSFRIDFCLFGLTNKLHALLHQIPHHAFHVPAYIAYLGKLGSLHFGKGRLGDFGQATCNFCLSYPRASDKQDIVGYDILLNIRGHPHPTNPVTQGNGHISLRVFLADDVLV